MRIFNLILLLLCLFSLNILGQNTQMSYHVVDSTTLMCVADTLYLDEEIRVEWFTNDAYGHLGHMDYDTMYFDLPVEDTFKVRSRKFVDVYHNGHVHTYWTWLHSFVTIEIEALVPHPVPTLIEPTWNSVTSAIDAPQGYLYVVQRFGPMVFFEQLTEPQNTVQLDLQSWDSGIYYIVFWSPAYQNSWTIYKQ